MITIRKSDIKWIIICGVIIIALIVLLVIALSGGKNPSTPSTSIPASVGVTPSPIITPSVQPSPEPSVSPTPSIEYMKVVNIEEGSALKVRSEASTDAEELARINNGEVVELVQRNAAEGWHKIKTQSGITGFCSADFLEDAEAPAATTSPGTGDPADSYVKVTADNVNLRKEATTDAESLALLAKDTVLKVLDNSVAGGWYKVETEGGVTGYCKSDYLASSASGW